MVTSLSVSDQVNLDDEFVEIGSSMSPNETGPSLPVYSNYKLLNPDAATFFTGSVDFKPTSKSVIVVGPCRNPVAHWAGVTGFVESGLLHGPVTFTYPNLTLSGTMHYGLRHGHWKHEMNGEIIKECDYYLGLRHGMMWKQNEDGDIRCRYSHGVLDGRLTMASKNLNCSLIFKKGKLMEVEKWEQTDVDKKQTWTMLINRNPHNNDMSVVSATVSIKVQDTTKNMTEVVRKLDTSIWMYSCGAKRFFAEYKRPDITTPVPVELDRLVQASQCIVNVTTVVPLKTSDKVSRVNSVSEYVGYSIDKDNVLYYMPGQYEKVKELLVFRKTVVCNQ